MRPPRDGAPGQIRIKGYGERFALSDQSILNHHYRGVWRPLPYGYNLGVKVRQVSPSSGGQRFTQCYAAARLIVEISGNDGGRLFQGSRISKQLPYALPVRVLSRCKAGPGSREPIEDQRIHDCPPSSCREGHVE